LRVQNFLIPEVLTLDNRKLVRIEIVSYWKSGEMGCVITDNFYVNIESIEVLSLI
jgi:hypothetical protein